MDFAGRIIGSELEFLRLCFFFCSRGDGPLSCSAPTQAIHAPATSCTEPLSTAPTLPAVPIPPALRPTNRSISALNFVSYLTATNTPVVFHRVAVPVFALRPAELPAELTPLACGEDEAASANFRCDSLLWREASPDRLSLHQLISFHARNLLNFGNGG